MDEHNEKDSAVGSGSLDSPATPKTQQQQTPHSPAKSPNQFLRQQSTPTSASPFLPTKNVVSKHVSNRPADIVKGTGSRPSSPIKQSGSRPSSRASSPLKWTPAPGKNEHLETTPTGFRYTIELPESKIVPKKNSSATPSKDTVTPVKSIPVTPASKKQSNSRRRTGSPSKSQLKSPYKEVLERAMSPKKKYAGAPGDAEPSPKASPRPLNLRKRASVKSTRTNGTHAGTPTVKVTKGDVWTGAKLLSPSTPESCNMEIGTDGKKDDLEKDRPHENEVPATPPGKSHPKRRITNGNQAGVAPTKISIPPSIPTNFGEMLRNSSQDVLQKSTDLSDKIETERIFSSPTVLDKVRRKSDNKTVSFLGVVTKPHFSSNAIPNENVSRVLNQTAHSLPESNPAKYTEQPQTPTGTPPALVAAMELEMKNMLTSLQQSLGEGYTSVSSSPVTAHWLGSNVNDDTSPTQAVRMKPTTVKDAPHLSLPQHRDITKTSSSPKASRMDRTGKAVPLTLRTKNKPTEEAQSAFRSRLPRLSPTKSKPKPPLQTSGTIPQAPRNSAFEINQPPLLSPSGVPAMASRRDRYVRAVQEEGEAITFASAEEIAVQIREWNTKLLGSKPATSSSAKSLAKPLTKPSHKTAAPTPRAKFSFMSPTATSVKKQATRTEKEKETFTPPGSPGTIAFLTRSPPKSQVLRSTKDAPSPVKKISSTLKSLKVRTFATPLTPLPRSNVNRRRKAFDQGALRTPSKEIVDKLDKEINGHLESQEREGRIFTPSGQRIQDLLAARRRGEGESESD